jgi:hypothetical protein
LRDCTFGAVLCGSAAFAAPRLAAAFAGFADFLDVSLVIPVRLVLHQGAASIGVAERVQPRRLEVFGHGHAGRHQFNPRIIYATIFQ